MSYVKGALAKFFEEKNKGKVINFAENGKRIDELLSNKPQTDDHKDNVLSEGKKSRKGGNTVFGFKKRKRADDEEMNINEQIKESAESHSEEIHNAVESNSPLSKKLQKKLKKKKSLDTNIDEKTGDADQESLEVFKSKYTKNEKHGSTSSDSGNVESSEMHARKQKKQKRKHKDSLVVENICNASSRQEDVSEEEPINASPVGQQNLSQKKGKKKNRKANLEKSAASETEVNQNVHSKQTGMPIEYAERASPAESKVDVVTVDSDDNEEVSCILIKRRKKDQNKKPNNAISDSLSPKKSSKQLIETVGDDARVSVLSTASPLKTKNTKCYVDEEMDTEFPSMFLNVDKKSSVSKQASSKKRHSEPTEDKVEPSEDGEQVFSKQASLNRLKEELKKKAKKFREKQVNGGSGFGGSSISHEKTHKKRCDIPGIAEEPELLKVSARTEELPDRTFESNQREEEEENVFKKNKGFSFSAVEFETDDAIKQDNPEKNKRTVFFGNMPVYISKKKVKKLFQQYGPIQSLRFRSFIPLKSNLSKKLAEIRKECHENVKSQKGYVVFKKVEDAKKALELNGTLIDGHHIRVDRAFSDSRSKSDDSRTVFVGSLSYDIDDETVWSKFSPCGEIEYVRIVRDNKTGLGKGFGFIQFKNASSVKAALKLNDTEVDGRNVRVKRCGKCSQESKSQKKFQNKDVTVSEGTSKKSQMHNNSKNNFTNSGTIIFGGASKKSGINKVHKSKKKLFKKRWREQEKKKVASIMKPFCESISTMSKTKTAKSSIVTFS